MFNLIQLQDRLRGFSEDQLKQFLRNPDPSIPDFMVMSALDEKNDAKVQEAQMKAQNQPSVREEMLAVAGLPAMEAGRMASSMAPKSDVRTNTGGDDMMTMARLAEDMPMEDDMEEDEELDIVETPIRRMNEGGQVKGAFFGGLQQFLNPDGTVKKEFEEAVKEAMKDDDASLTGGSPYEMDKNRTQIFSKPEKDDDETPPPGTDDPAPMNYLGDLTASLDKMRADQKEQMEKNQALGIMLEGLKLARRGVIDDETGKGLQFMGQQQAKVQDRLAQLQGLEAKIGIAGATLAQKDRATKAALDKALKKSSSMTTAQLASEIKGYSSEIGKLRKQLGEETIAFDDARIAETEDEIKRLAELRSLYVADLKSRYGGDILENDFLKTLLDETQEDK